MWNHRIVKTEDENGQYLELVEVFYDCNNLPYAYGQANIASEDVDGINLQIEMFNTALTKPILNYPEDFTGDVNK